MLREMEIQGYIVDDKFFGSPTMSPMWEKHFTDNDC